MKLDKLNSWLTLVSNLGVLLGIFVLVYELRQTQTDMKADSMVARTQMTMQVGEVYFRNRIYEVLEKYSSDQALSSEELYRMQEWLSVSLRTWESSHYQYQLGVLDEEIWQSHLSSIITVCSSPIFAALGGKDGMSLNIYRASFVDLLLDPCR